MCLTNNSLFLPLQKMKNTNPKFAACQLYIRDTKEKLEDGLNSLDSVEDTFDIAIDDQVILTVDMELLKKRTCSVGCGFKTKNEF